MNNGKGDKPRPTDKKAYDANYEKIFGKPTDPKKKGKKKDDKHAR